MNKVNIKVNSHDIFNFVVGNSVFDPIERCIDPTRYEVFDNFVYILSVGPTPLYHHEKYAKN